MSRLCAFGASLFAGLLCLSGAWHADAKPPKRDRPLLFGGPVTKLKAKLPLDPRLPTGADLPATEPRPGVTASLCSFSRPVCVHATGAAQEPALHTSLQALERAYESVVLALKLPPPLPDRGAGGTDGLDWYVTAPSAAFAAVAEALLPGRMDQAPVSCRGPAGAGPLLERQATLCVG